MQVWFIFSLDARMALTRAIQIGSRVRWWDTRGQLKHGTVKAINVLNDVRPWADLPLPDPHIVFYN